jgi:hypothetical protein
MNLLRAALAPRARAGQPVLQFHVPQPLAPPECDSGGGR